MTVGNIVALISFGNIEPLNLSIIDLLKSQRSDNNANSLNDSYPQVIALTDCSC
jgi:hypothetical protein